MSSPPTDSPARPTPPALDIRGLGAWFGDRHVLRGVDLGVPRNSVTALIGPSGCGKSTLLRCMNRMHETVPGARSEGSVLLDGVDVHGAAVDPVLLRRRVGMVFQKPNPFPGMTVLANAVAGLRLTGRLSPGDAAALAERALRGAALWDEVKDDLDRPGSRLSGGQQQRLCIARTIATEPDVILMDEPCSALDPIATEKIEALIVELSQRFTVVIVTHNLQQAHRIATHAGFMLLGELVEFGEAAAVFEAPADPRTANYLAGRFG